MKPTEIEHFVLEVVDRVRHGSAVEDLRVELKRQWPVPTKAARRIAGHANAARGERIFWIIGLDEGGGEEEDPVAGADQVDIASWWAGVSAEFSQLPPEMQHLVVPVDDGRVVAGLVFDTTRAPFVVRNPAHGQEGGGPVSLEVPWREGTAVRSATRSELVLMIGPPAAEIGVVVLGGQLLHRDGQDGRYWDLRMDLYLDVPELSSPLVIPDHVVRVEAQIAGDGVWLRESRLDSPESVGETGDLPPASPARTSYRGSGQLIIQGSGPVALLAHGWPEMGPKDPGSTDDASVSFVVSPLRSSTTFGLSDVSFVDADPRWFSPEYSDVLSAWTFPVC